MNIKLVSDSWNFREKQAIKTLLKKDVIQWVLMFRNLRNYFQKNLIENTQ